MAGHGHVTPNADGSKARCGGPGMCAECSIEYAQAQLGKPKHAWEEIQKRPHVSTLGPVDVLRELIEIGGLDDHFYHVRDTATESERWGRWEGDRWGHPAVERWGALMERAKKLIGGAA